MISDTDFKRLLDFYNRPWCGYRKVRKGVKKRIGRHMQQIGCPQMDCYLAALEQQPDLRKSCEQHLTVTISRFFRDRKLWDHLGNRVLPELIQHFNGEIQAWSAGCSNGEEPYSLAIVWDQIQDQVRTTPQRQAHLNILATDIRPDSLEKARQGIYDSGSLKEVSEDIRKQYFTASNRASQYKIKQQIIDMVCRQMHDLLHQPAPGKFHLIFLRNNLLTYYQGAQLVSAFKRVLQALYPHGALIVGSHEKPPSDAPLMRDQWAPWIYYKKVGMHKEGSSGG
jgi:chemotaxis methyl-accepting protein methylase